MAVRSFETPSATWPIVPGKSETVIRNNDPLLVDLLNRVQNDLRPDRREEIAQILAANRAMEVAPQDEVRPPPAGKAALAADGYVPLGRILDQPKVARLVGHLKARQVYAAHIPGYSDGEPRSIAATREHSDHGSYSIADVLTAPGVLELALRQDLVDLATAYLGALPYLYSAHAWWTYANRPGTYRTHKVHRDQDDFGFLSIFVYLTDVEDEDDGPMVYYTGSHRLASLAPQTVESSDPALRAMAERIGTIYDFFPPRAGNATRLDDELRVLLKSSEVAMLGPAGTGFAADTFGLHRGTKPASGDRLALWLRYGLYRNWGYQISRFEAVRLPPELCRDLTPLQWSMLELLVERGDP